MAVSISFSIPGKEGSALKKKMIQTAHEKGMTLSEWIVEACAEYLRNNK